jgi:non-specific serine/threonine protein kinase
VHHASAVRYRGALVVLGGFNGAGANLFGSTSNKVWRLSGGRWERLPSMMHARGAGAAGVVGDRLVVAAGQADGRLVSETDIFDGNRWRGGTAIPTVRDHVASASDGKYLYVISGRRLAINSVLPAFERYDPQTDRWEDLPDVPTPRGGFGAAFLEGVLVTVGGEGPAGTYPQVESFGPEKQWSRLPAMLQARHGVGVGSIGPALYVAVGGPTAGGSYSSRLDVFSLS